MDIIILGIYAYDQISTESYRRILRIKLQIAYFQK